MNQILSAIYTGPGLAAPANEVIRIPTVDGTISEVFLDLTDVSDGDALWNLTIDGVEIVSSTDLTIADGDSNVTVSALSQAMTAGGIIALNLETPPTTLPDPPFSLVITYDDGVSALPEYTPASASGPASLIFKEDTDNGTNKITVIAPSSIASDKTQTFQDATGTIALTSIVDDTAYDATSWNGDTTHAPTKNAVRDKIEDILDGCTFSGDIIVPDEAYDATNWNGSLEVPTKNAVRDKIESLGLSIPFTAADSSGAAYLDFAEDTDNGTNRVRLQGAASTADVTVTLPSTAGTVALTSIVDDTVYGAGWNGDTTHAPSKNAVYDKIESISAGTLPDGDYGDIVVSGSGTVLSIDSGVIVNADINASAAIDISKLGTSTTQALGVGSIELGHASDTTLSRSSAGVLAVEGVTVPLNSTSSVHTASSIELGHASDTTLARASAGEVTVEGTPLLKAGKQTIYIPASAMIPATTNGPSSAQLESATNKLNYSVLDFDGTTQEYAHFQIAFPKSWDEGTVTFKAFWATTNTGTAGIAIGLQGIAASDADTIDTAFGTAVYVTDAAQSSAAKQYVTAESGAVTIGGSPAEGDICYMRVTRDPSNGSDTMSEDMRLIGIQVYYTTNASTDA